MHLKSKKLKVKLAWNDNAKNIIGKINGLYPVPGAFFIYKGERYKILKAEIGNGALEIQVKLFLIIWKLFVVIN